MAVSSSSNSPKKLVTLRPLQNKRGNSLSNVPSLTLYSRKKVYIDVFVTNYNRPFPMNSSVVFFLVT